MHSVSRFASCVVALCAASPALALSPDPTDEIAPAVQPPVGFDASRFAASLEAVLKAAQETLGLHGEQLEALLATPPATASSNDLTALGHKLVTEVGQTRSSLPPFALLDEHLFEELFAELRTLEQSGEALASGRDPDPRARFGALHAKGPGLASRLGSDFRKGITRLGERLEAPPALVVSGGVSLGSYQAGFLYYYTLFLHDRAYVLHAIPPANRAALRALGLELPEDPPSGFTIVTGASAGSVNALLAGYAGCLEPERVPSKSLFFQTWNTLSMEALLQQGSVGYDHAFSSAPITTAMNRLKALDPSQWRRCRFSLGATVTRLIPREIDLAAPGELRSRSKEPIRLPRFTEKFLLTADGGQARAPAFCPFPGCDAQQTTASSFYPRLAEPAGEPIPLDSVFNMVAASGAFPTAFEPRHISHRYFDSAKGGWIDDDKTLFADGGIYNNNPLGVAVLMSESEPSAVRGNHRFLYFDPNEVDWTWSSEKEQHWSGPGLLSTYESLLKGFAGTAMNAQLMDTLEEKPDIRERLDVPVRHAPLAGEHLLAMSAFLDEDFRTFDFHRGMMDAWQFLTRESDTQILFGMLARTGTASLSSAVSVSSPLFECFLAFETSPVDEPGALPECSRLHAEDSPNLLSLMAASRKLKKDPTLSQNNKFERFSDALAERGYVFRSGMLKGQPASALRRQFRLAAGEAVDQLTRLQPSDQRLGFQVATKLALDSGITYRPVPLYGFVGVTSSGLELAVSPVLSQWEDKEVRLRVGARGAYEQAVPLSQGDVTQAIDTEAYAGGVFGLGLPTLQGIRLELGLGILSDATYLFVPREWASLRFAVEGALALVVVEHIEIALRPRLYLDLGQETSSLYLHPANATSRHLDAVALLLGVGWRF